MKDDNKTRFAGYWLRRFLEEYMVTVRNLSANTRKSYRDTFRLLLLFVSKSCKKTPDELLLTEIDDTSVLAFLSNR